VVRLTGLRLLGLTVGLLAAVPPTAVAKRGGQTIPSWVSVSGYVHVQWAYDMHAGAYPRQTFNLRRARVKFFSEVSDVGADVELGCDELTPTIEDAYLYCHVFPVLSFVAGLRKMPFSLEELTPARKLLMIERGLANDMFGDNDYLGRDIGLAVEGAARLHHVPFTYSAGVFNGSGAKLSTDYNNAKQFVERVTVEPLTGLTVGLNATQRNDSLTGKVVTAWGGDFVGRFGKATVEGEVLAGNSEPGRHMLGGYVVGAYRLGAFEPGLKVERLVPDLTDAGDNRTEFTAACNWYLHERLELKANLVGDATSRGTFGYEVLTQAQVSF
jgi:hypothetical protein